MKKATRSSSKLFDQFDGTWWTVLSETVVLNGEKSTQSYDGRMKILLAPGHPASRHDDIYEVTVETYRRYRFQIQAVEHQSWRPVGRVVMKNSTRKGEEAVAGPFIVNLVDKDLDNWTNEIIRLIQNAESCSFPAPGKLLLVKGTTRAEFEADNE